MKDLHKSWLYWSVLIFVVVAIGFVVFNSTLIRIVMFSTLILLLLFDTYRQFRLQKRSILLSIKNMVVKLFDIITSLG